MTVTTTATTHFILSADEVKTLRKAHEILYKMYEQTKEETDTVTVKGFTEYDPNEPEAFGEIGLGGELRNISYAEQRITEAERMGFERCILPVQSLKGIDLKRFGIKVIGVRDLRQAFNSLGG